MKIEESLIKQIKVSDLERLDPITIVVEDVAYGKAHVTIKCYDKSWTSYWGAMGGSVKEFFSRVNVGYLVNCFDKGIRSETDEKDIESMEKVFHHKIKQRILEDRVEYRIRKESARMLWEEVENIDFEQIVPEYDHECFSWKLDHHTVNTTIWNMLFDYDCIIEDKSEDFQYWLWENVPFVYKRNHQYDYLCRIVEVVKKVLSEEEVNDKSIKNFK